MKIKIGFVGTGSIAIPHIANLAANPDAEVTALCDISPETIDRAVASVNAIIEENKKDKAAGGAPFESRKYLGVKEMFKEEKLDGVYICIPPFAHGQPEKEAIEAGVGMFVEKPVALDLDLAADIASGIAEKGIISSVGYQLRYSNIAARVREVLDGRKIAGVTGARFGKVPSSSWWTVQEKSGGQLVEMATHEIDLMRYFIGDIKTVYSAAGTRIYSNRPNFNIFDMSCMTMVFENGVPGSFANSCACRYGNPAGAGGITILAEDATISYSNESIEIITENGIESMKSDGDPMALADSAFIESLKTGNVSGIHSDYLDGAKTLAVTLGADLSARSGSVVDTAGLMRRLY